VRLCCPFARLTALFAEVGGAVSSEAWPSLVQLGANIEAVREMMGHATVAQTSTYLHATSDDKVRAIGLLSGNYGETKE